MMSKKYVLMVLLSCFMVHNAYGKSKKQRSKKPLCTTENQCKDQNNSCSCYCSELCGPRVKRSDDPGIFIKDDPAGNYCYCQEWDVEKYNENCAKKAQ